MGPSMILSLKAIPPAHIYNFYITPANAFRLNGGGFMPGERENKQHATAK